MSAQTLLGALRSASRRCGGARMDIVSHSMGGLVVRSLLADHPEAFEKLVRAGKGGQDAKHTWCGGPEVT